MRGCCGIVGVDAMRQSEFELIDRIRGLFGVPEGMRGIGDDCAVIPQSTGKDLLVSTDLLVEKVHFLMDRISAYDLGWKSAAVNISDIAAMGGRPVATFLSIAIPKDVDDGWMDQFMKGYAAISNIFSVALLGGDTTGSPDSLCINVAVLGECEHGAALLRSCAQPGDDICVTGNLGDSAAGLKCLLEEIHGGENLIRAHCRPYPRVEEGLLLSKTDGVGAVMDISDGVASDIRHIMSESHVGARIDVSSLPLSAGLREICTRYGWDPVELALCGGEDYELLFTCRKGADIPVAHTVIGEIVEGGDLTWLGRGVSGKEYRGFEHF